MAARFNLTWFNFETATAAEIDQINTVYATVFAEDIGIQFNPALDEDCKSPLKYYGKKVRGAYIVVRDTQDANRIVGTGGIRDLTYLQNECELKRMFFLKVCRGHKLGQAVCQALIDKAIALGYRAMVLDTKKKLQAANRVYEKMGFVDCENYNKNPRADRFMRLHLTRIASASSKL